MWLGIWFGIVVTIGIFNATERSMIGMCGENLTFNVRKQTVRGIMFKQLCWFDRENRAPGVLTNILSEDISTLNGMTTETIIVLIEAIMGLTFGFVFGIILCWQQAFMTMACTPLLMVGVVAMSRLQWGNKGGRQVGTTVEADVYEKANALLSDVVLNYKTVIAFGDKNVNNIFDKLNYLMIGPVNLKIKNSHIAGFFFGYS